VVFTRFRISTQLLILVTATAFLTLVLLVITTIVQSRTLIQQQTSDQATAVTIATGDLITASLTAHDSTSVQRIVTSIVQHNTIGRVSVFDQAGALISTQTSPDVMSASDPNEEADFAHAALQADRPLSRTMDDDVDLADLAGVGAHHH